jgi:hypothetical protein
MVARSVILATLLAACAGSALAQAPPATAPHRGEIPLTQGLHPLLTTVRVRTGDGEYVAGVVQRAAADTLLIRQQRLHPATTPLPHAAIDSLWVRRSAWRRGAVIGALAATAFYVYTAATLDDDDVNAAHMMVPTTTGEAVVFGVVVGGGFGTLIGSRFRHWQLRYAAPARAR